MENRCICCGEIIPEGRQVCYQCEYSINEDIKIPSNDKVSLFTYIVNKYFKKDIDFNKM